mmetsp:Transcript_39772/g.78389  ORF Transcript_39772/g.78389 Transcript_39772/m.78389 type:complete len:121 (-) Transcript_39772:426-788(-)
MNLSSSVDMHAHCISAWPGPCKDDACLLPGQLVWKERKGKKAMQPHNVPCGGDASFSSTRTQTTKSTRKKKRKPRQERKKERGRSLSLHPIRPEPRKEERQSPPPIRQLTNSSPSEKSLH